MIGREYEVRKIVPADRAEWSSRIARAEARGDHEEAEASRTVFAEWEQEQGQRKKRLACAVCGDWWLVPTHAGTARPHTRRNDALPTWDKVRQLRKDIKALQGELDRALEHLEPD